MGQLHALKTCNKAQCLSSGGACVGFDIPIVIVWPSLSEFLKDYGEVKLLL